MGVLHPQSCRTVLFAVLAMLLALPAHAERIVALGDDSGSELARRAIEQCSRASTEMDPVHAIAGLEHALALAERAVAEDPRDAKAHFAVFCSLGRRAELEGAGLGALSSLARMQESLDQALALEPTFVDALVAKGRMLARLPWVLGGDAAEGERLIRRALELAPDSAVARLQLAHLMAEQGESSKARRLARAALALAERLAESRVREEASILVASLDG